MSQVTMEKDGATIRVAEALVTEHEALGWHVKSIANALANADIVIGDEDTNTINVTIQLQDESGAALAESMSLQAFLSDDTAGLGVTSGAPDGHVAIGTAGECIHLVTDKVFLLNTNAAGALDLDLVESGAGTWYLVLVFPNGERVVSDAITFA
jgi:hypothetical protein